MSDQSHEIPMSGGIPYAIGQASVVRIPIPGTDRLCIELRPRGHVPPGGSTSTLFFQFLCRYPRYRHHEQGVCRHYLS